MNTIKKIGLTALGTTLVAGSAFAGEITASGDAGYTWASEATGTTTTDGAGFNHDITFSGSGELDNGWSVSTTMILVEGATLSSSNVKLTMGSLGSVRIGSGTGGTGASYDNVVPTAYEENHDGMATSTALDNMGGLLGNGQIDYFSPSLDIGGGTLDFMYAWAPEASNTAITEGGVSTAAVAHGSGWAAGVNISMGGLSAGAYHATATADGPLNTTEVTGVDASDANDSTWFAKYTAGPVSFGYQKGVIDRGIAAAASTVTTAAKTVAAAGGDFESEAMSIAFNVNENLSVSWSELEETYDEQDAAATAIADVTMESKSIQFAYTMGSMSIKGYQTDTDNPGWDSDAKSDEVTELAINFAF